MKKYIFIFLACMVIFSCSKDDLSWQEEIESIKTELVNQKKLIEALQANANITSIKQEQGQYTISFSNGQSITLQNGSTPLITIGDNGNWFINGEDTGKPSSGENGKDGIDGTNGVNGINGADGMTPKIDIKDGCWFINGENTNIKAVGADGANGKDAPYITYIVEEFNNFVFTFSDKTTLRCSKRKVFSGKNIVTFGDSVTEFGNYPELIGDITGATIYKIGFGGCRMSMRNYTSKNMSWAYDEISMYRIAESLRDRDFAEMESAIKYLKEEVKDDNSSTFRKLTNIDFSKVDICTIFFGTNDFTGCNRIGNKESVNPNELKGAMNIVIKCLTEINPKMEIVFIAPTHRFFGADNSYNSDVVPNSIGLYLEDYSNAIEEQANYNHIACLNLYKNGGFNRYNHESFFVDGVHPNKDGYKRIAELLSSFLVSKFGNFIY